MSICISLYKLVLFYYLSIRYKSRTKKKHQVNKWKRVRNEKNIKKLQLREKIRRKIITLFQ